MKFRIKKEDGLYFGEYKRLLLWWFIPGSVSRRIEKTKRVCEEFELPKVVEKFKL